MGITDKLPLLNSKSKVIKIVGYVLYAFVILMIIGAMTPQDDTGSASATEALRTDVGGWTFVADLGDGWRTTNETSSFNPSEEIENPDDAEGWKGISALSFYYPTFPNAPKENERYDSYSSSVYIYVLKIPDEIKREKEEYNIARYGSIEKIPDDAKEQDMKDILKDVAKFVWGTYRGQQPDEEYIQIGDRMAYLIDRNIDASGISTSEGIASVVLDADTIGVISAYANDFNRPDEAYYKEGDARDIIKAFKISHT